MARTATGLVPKAGKAHHITKLVSRAARQMQVGQFDRCIASYNKLIALIPHNAQLYQNLGVALIRKGDPEKALRAFKEALAIDPVCAEANSNIGTLLHEHNQTGKAVAFLERAIDINPQFLDAHNNLASAFTALGRIEEAIGAYRQSLAIDPQGVKARYELYALRRQTCDWSGLEAEEERCLQQLKHDNVRVPPYSILAIDHELSDLLWHNRLYASGFEVAAGEMFKHTVKSTGKAQTRRIRIGYLSSDLRQHAVGTHMVELFEQHDRSRFEIFGYCFGKDDGSTLRSRIVNAFDHFSSINTKNDRDAAQQIYNDKIDILVDLNGYTGPARTKILAYKPAPSQVSFLGYPSTMGANFIDYVLADPIITPLDHQPYFREAIVHLPDTYQPNDSQKKISTQKQTRKMNGLPLDGFVFCSFNSAFKISPQVFSLWMRLLSDVEQSVLWLFESNALCKTNLQRQALDQGIDPSRLIFAPKIPIDKHLARLQLADLFLDCVPVNAHATAADALWAGLPVITCMGKTLVGRVAASLLHAVGLPELVTTSLDEYEQLALQLARNSSMLHDLRSRLAENKSTAPLFNIKKYTNNLEQAYVHMVHLHTSGQSPAPFAVSEISAGRSS